MNEQYLTKEYISALEARDESVLGLVEKSYGRLLRSLGKNLHMSDSDTEECISDALLCLWNTIPPAKPTSVRTYLCRLMRSAVVDKIRYNSAGKRGNTVFLDLELELADGTETDNAVIDAVCIPEILNTFLRSRSPKDREIFIRRYYEFEGTRSIAQDLFMTDASVRKRLSRMRDELREILKKEGYDYEK